MSNVKNEINLVELPQTNSRIGKTSKYKGTLRFKTSLSILGSVSGTIIGGDLLVIFPSASIEAQIEADFILIAGTLHGVIYARKGLLVYSTAYIRGDIHAAKIRMQPNVNFEGSCNLLGTEKIDINNFTRANLRAKLFEKFDDQSSKYS